MMTAQANNPDQPKNPMVGLQNAAGRALNLMTISIIIGLIYLAGAALFLSRAFQLAGTNSAVQPIYYTLGFAFGAVVIVSGVVATNFFIRSVTRRAILLAAVVQLSLILFAFRVADLGVPIAIIALIFTTVLGFATLRREQSDLLTNFGIFSAVLIALINILTPLTQVEIQELKVFVPTILGIQVMIYIVLMAMELVSASLRIKTTSAFLAITLVPVTLLAVIQSNYTQRALRAQNTEGLVLAAVQSSNVIEDFIKTNLYNASLDASLPIVTEFVEADDAERSGTELKQELEYALSILTRSRQQSFLNSYAILDQNGRNIYDTNKFQQVQNESSQEFFISPLISGRPYVSPIFFDDDDNPYIVFSAPIFNRDREVIGVLRVRYMAIAFQRSLENYKGLFGRRSYPILLDENFVRVADVSNPGLIYRPIEPISAANMLILQSTRRTPTNALGDDETVTPYIPEMAKALRSSAPNPYFTFSDPGTTGQIVTAGTAVRLSSTKWYLVYIQRLDLLAQLFDEQNRVSLLVATLIAGMVSVVASQISRILSSPIINLTATAERIAGGDLEAEAVVESGDETGALAVAFNQMTSQVRTLIIELEDRVKARTQELAAQNETLVLRSQQLQTVSEVARGITSTRELERLLTQVTELISERFNFYHVGVFLIDEQGEFAVLRAANSEGGQRMLARQHKLRVGAVGIVGYTTGYGVPRIATDVGQDAVFFNNPDLPLTRSEMALPLKVGDQIIGAMDVQSTEANAFSAEDIELFSVLADQVAIAILNNQLYEETNRALEESQALHRNYLRMEWTREGMQRRINSYAYTQKGVEPRPVVLTPTIEKALNTGETQVQAQEESTLTIPISLRGEPIGVIHLQEQSNAQREWTEEDITTVQSVADQIAQTLENARLFEQTMRRAERERKVLEITSKIRSTNDIQTMIQIAAQELQQTLNASHTQVILQSAPSTPGQAPNSGNGHSGNGHQPDGVD